MAVQMLAYWITYGALGSVMTWIRFAQRIQWTVILNPWFYGAHRRYHRYAPVFTIELAEHNKINLTKPTYLMKDKSRLNLI